MHGVTFSNDPIPPPFHLTLSPHRRISAPRLILAFAHIHGEAEAPTLGIRSAVAGRQGLFCYYLYLVCSALHSFPALYYYYVYYKLYIYYS
jgi:hypothetical protein